MSKTFELKVIGLSSKADVFTQVSNFAYFDEKTLQQIGNPKYIFLKNPKRNTEFIYLTKKSKLIEENYIGLNRKQRGKIVNF